MTQATLIAFGVNFVAGPLLCALLLRLPATLWTMGVLAIGVVLAAAAALRPEIIADGVGLTALGLLWLAWVLAIAMVTLALRRRIRTPSTRRWLTIGALLATTLPWFGLATAQLVA